MAEANSMKREGFVPFYADADDYCRINGSREDPVMIINPDASSADLWSVAEARILQLQRMLNVFVCIDECGVDFSPSEYAAMFKPRVDEILILAAEGNRKAKTNQVLLKPVTAVEK